MIKKDEGIDPYPYYKFVSRAFYELRGYKLGQQAYIFYLCYWLTSLWSGVIRKLIINLPPKHLKTFMCTICMVAWTLAHRPRLDILVVTCSEELADEIGKSIVALLQTPWYIGRYGRRLIRKNVDPTNFQTPQGGTVRVVA